MAGKKKYRYERKFFVSNDNLDALRNRLTPFLNPDIYTQLNEKGISEYQVKSIYFDTPSMRFYHEKKDGLEHRNKFRIRTYDDYYPGVTAFLEIKQKTGDRISKIRAPFNFDGIKPLLEFGDLAAAGIKMKDEASASHYLYHHFRNSLRPINLVVYEREAYLGKFDSDLRITFDKNIRTALYPNMQELFECSRTKYLNPEAFVLEVKYSETPPTWIFSIVEEFSLKLKAISKYADGIDTHTGMKRIRVSPIGFAKLDYLS